MFILLVHSNKPIKLIVQKITMTQAKVDAIQLPSIIVFNAITSEAMPTIIFRAVANILIVHSPCSLKYQYPNANYQQYGQGG